MKTTRRLTSRSRTTIPRPDRSEPKYKLITREAIFSSPLQSTDDAFFSLKVYAAAYLIFSADFRDPLGQASLRLLDDCAHHFASGEVLNLR